MFVYLFHEPIVLYGESCAECFSESYIFDKCVKTIKILPDIGDIWLKSTKSNQNHMVNLSKRSVMFDQIFSPCLHGNVSPGLY